MLVKILFIYFRDLLAALSYLLRLMDIIIVWNCNGAASKSFLRTLKELLNRLKSGILGLVETKCIGDHTNTIYNPLGFEYWTCVEALGFSGGIWLFWKENLHLKIIKTHPQFLHVRVARN